MLNKISVLTLFLIHGSVSSANCFAVIANSEKIILQSHVELHTQFDFQTDDINRPVGLDSGQFLNFKQWVSTFASTNQRDLLKQQLDGLGHIKDNDENRVWVSNAKKRHVALLNDEVGQINSISCFVRELFDTQLRRFSPMIYPSEFMALLLQSKTDSKLYRVYFSIGDGIIFDVSPPQNQKVWDLLAKDLSNGWKFFSHIHSHPFMINYAKVPHVGGTVYPSDEDIQSYQYWGTYGLKEAWITNGFDLIRFTSIDVHELSKTIPSHAPYNGAKVDLHTGNE